MLEVMRTPYWLDSRPIADSASCGDLVAFFPLDADLSAIVIGDVAGRGPTAGVAARALLAFARIAVASHLPLRTALHHVDEFFTRAVMCNEIPLASLFLAVADTTDCVLDYASAGHEPALHFTSDTRHDHLYPTGPLLGLEALAPSRFTQRRVHFATESILTIVTDGITEARRYEADGPQFFGSIGVARALAKARRTQVDPAHAIGAAAAQHANGKIQDDASVLVVGLGRSSRAL